MKYFVAPQSIVREIWSSADTVLFIFAGAAAEFSLNKAVDWLYFTGRLPGDPIGRLFSTVHYARQIIFLPEEKALDAIDRVSAIHSSVEISRGFNIPDWAYRDVLFMLVNYSVSSFELLKRKLNDAEKEEIVSVFMRVGNRMNIPGLPDRFVDWQKMYHEHMRQDLEKSVLTSQLYASYKTNLGRLRYHILLMVQSKITPKHVSQLLKLKSYGFEFFFTVYKVGRFLRLHHLILLALLPPKYKSQLREISTKT